jgi:8-oxo-dGTP pyrophosphatase MutT (NUDIX family)
VIEVKIIKKETVFEGEYLKFVRKHFKTDRGEGIWETIERKNIYNKGAVVIVALTKERELILERNWRAPLESFVIQFPAGLIDKEGESEEEVARRELLEETGYKAQKLIPVIPVPLCPALIPTRATHFFAPEVEFIGKESEEITEEIEVLKVPVERVDDFLLNLPKETELDLRVPGILWILQRKKLI